MPHYRSVIVVDMNQFPMDLITDTPAPPGGLLGDKSTPLQNNVTQHEEEEEPGQGIEILFSLEFFIFISLQQRIIHIDNFSSEK